MRHAGGQATPTLEERDAGNAGIVGNGGTHVEKVRTSTSRRRAKARCQPLGGGGGENGGNAKGKYLKAGERGNLKGGEGGNSKYRQF